MTAVVHLVEKVVAAIVRHHVDHHEASAVAQGHLIHAGQETLHAGALQVHVAVVVLHRCGCVDDLKATQQASVRADAVTVDGGIGRTTKAGLVSAVRLCRFFVQVLAFRGSEAVGVKECPAIVSLLQLRQELDEFWAVVADQRRVVDWMIDALVHDLLGDGERRALNN